MCPALGPAWAPPRVGTARGVLTLEWPEARAAAQGGRTEASARGSASSSGPARLGQMEGRLSRRRTDGQLPSSQRCFQDRAGQDSGKALLGRCCRAPGTFAIPAPAALCRGGGTLSGASPPQPPEALRRGRGALSGASLPGQHRPGGLPRGGRASCLFHKQPAAQGPRRGSMGGRKPTASARSGREAGSAPAQPLCSRPSSQAPASQNLRPRAWPPLLLPCLGSCCFCS